MWLLWCCITAFLLFGFLSTWLIIPQLKSRFIKRGICGRDLNKDYNHLSEEEIPKIPEAQGVITGCIFLILTIIGIPSFIINIDGVSEHGELYNGENIRLLQILGALLSICSMVLLGFADDVLDLKWRHKIFLPAIASLPLLVIYSVTSNQTEIALPLYLRSCTEGAIDIGILYYLYMGMLAIFCTNAINILAGINGIEVGQSCVIAISIVIFNLIEMHGKEGSYHKFSIYFLCPYLATSLPLLWYNWYPSEVFPGDTFCYFSGMTFAVVAILGHFSETLMLFFIPQVINFMYSAPQLFKLLPCPRHRLPTYNENIDKVEMSLVKVKASDLSMIGTFVRKIFKFIGIAHVNEYKENDTMIEFNNLTIINMVLHFLGPMHEKTLTCTLLGFQILCNIVGLLITYQHAFCYIDILFFI
jgi:UDP-N-acetylglucosamine--dolichyl-phosphate N-acetylglucosaminephosphotransferase